MTTKNWAVTTKNWAVTVIRLAVTTKNSAVTAIRLAVTVIRLAVTAKNLPLTGLNHRSLSFPSLRYPAADVGLPVKMDARKVLLRTAVLFWALSAGTARADTAEPAPAAQLAAVVVAPADGSAVGSEQVTVRVRIRSPAGAQLTVRSEVEGEPQGRGFFQARAEGGGAQQDTLCSVPVRIPRRDSTIRITVETAGGASEPVLLHLRWAGEAGGAAEHRPRLYMLSVGVSRYRKAELALRYPSKDAADLASALTEQTGKRFVAVETRVLADREATLEHILDGFQWLQQKTSDSDVAVLFLAGHGINDPASGDYLFLPHDARPEDRATLLAGAAIQAALRQIKGKVLAFLDTCHAGNVLGAATQAADQAPLARQLASEEGGVVVFSASTGRQTSLEDPRWGNGVFTKALVEGLRGQADGKRTGRVTVAMLDLYISERVRELTRGKQTPATAKPSSQPDFTVAELDAPVVLLRRPLSPRARRLRFAALGLSAAGVLALVAGGVLSGLDEGQACSLGPKQKQCPQLYDTLPVGASLLGAGLVAVGTSGLLLGLSYRPERGGAALALAGSF